MPKLPTTGCETLPPRRRWARSARLCIIALSMASLASCSHGVVEEKIASTTQALNASPKIADFVLYAQRKVTLGAHDIVGGGDVGVAAAAPSTFGSQLVVGAHSQVASADNLLSPSATLAAKASVGDVQTNSLTNNGGTLHTLAPYPFSLPSLPLARPSSVTGADVTVGASQAVTLDAGTYGNLSVADHGVLTLGPGTFYFSSVALADHSQLTGDAAGVTVQVAGTFTAGGWVSISSQAQTAHALSIDVAGRDGSSTPAASLGSHDEVTALVAVPHGTLSLADHVQLTGAFAAFDVVAGDYLQATYEDGFSSEAAYPHGQQVITGQVAPNIAAGKVPVVGPVPANLPVTLLIGLRLHDEDKLDALIDQLYDPGSTQYHQYISPSDFGDRYGASAQDYKTVTDFVGASGLQLLRTYTNRYAVSVSAPASVIENALFVTLNMYQRPDGSTFYAPANDPSADLSVQVLHISGLDNFPVATPADGSGPTGCGGSVHGRQFTGYDFRHAYLPCLPDPIASPSAGSQGSGQTIAIFAEDGINTQDVTAYANAYLKNTPNVVAKPVLPSTAPFEPVTPGNWKELDLDIDMALSIAPAATIEVYEENPFASGSSYTVNPPQAMIQIAADNSAKVISSSYIWPPGYSLDSLIPVVFKEFAAQGQSFFQSSGDLGAYVATSKQTFAPPPMLYTGLMTVVGGTSLTTATVCDVNLSSPLSPCSLPATYPSPYYGQETTWVDLGGNGAPPKGASGGGFLSGLVDSNSGVSYPAIPLPTYQQSVTTWVAPTNPDLSQNTSNARMIPDVSLIATNIEIWESSVSNCTGTGVNQTCSIVSGSSQESSCTNGTSASAPLWAGIAALINEKSTRGPIGFINPALYRIAANQTSFGSNFNDIVTGNNDLACAPNCTAPITYSAYTGYDLATGLGSPQCTLLSQLATGVTCTAGGPVVNLDTDKNNCGFCGNVCVSTPPPNGVPTPPGVTPPASNPSCCAAECTDLSTDVTNCGACGNACTTGQTCCGACTDLTTDVNNCGICGRVCGTGQSCCGGACSDPATDQNNCGGCGTHCAITCSTSSCTTAKSISGVGSQTCALISDGTAACWGRLPGSASLGTGVIRPTKELAAGLSGASMVSAGGEESNGTMFACALETGGTVTCWGDNPLGELGDGTTNWNQAPSTTVSSITTATSVAAGQTSSCALLSSGKIECWGDNSSGQLGTTSAVGTCGGTACSTTPVFVSGITSAKAVSVGRVHACAVLSDGTVQCWGANFAGQLGNNTQTASPTPVAVSGLTNVVAISAAEWSTCAVTSGGSVYCWGEDGFGELGAGTTTTTCDGTGRACALVPVQVPGVSGITTVSVGALHVCALTSNGGVVCWGSNQYGQCGTGSTSTTSLPTTVANLPVATGVAANTYSTCAVSGGTQMMCWGDDTLGELGDSQTGTGSSTPVLVK